MARIAHESWSERVLGAEEDEAPRPPVVDILSAMTTNSRKAQHILGKLVIQGLHAAHIASLHLLLETARAPGPNDTRWQGGRPKHWRRLATGGSEGQELPHAFGRGQRTRYGSYPQQSSWALEGVSWGLRNMWQ